MQNQQVQGQAPAAQANLLNTLGSELKITPEQAIGGAGAMLGLARNNLSGDDYGQLTKAVPGLDLLSGNNALGPTPPAVPRHSAAGPAACAVPRHPSGASSPPPGSPPRTPPARQS
ncbi:hypothetical protein WR25_15879 [Diploscapter pachys]|uniref:Uncharacterized protein n=1 Tax=Diploscapter pachys TaxID=2018661 RepID=A0A2A2KF56_9BILA|nr:hypothetical protein WR25_15879 [Diploscapter pachys]